MTSVATPPSSVDAALALLIQIADPNDVEFSTSVWNRIEAVRYFPLVADCKIDFTDLDAGVQSALREMRYELDPISDIMFEAVAITRRYAATIEDIERQRAIDEARSRT
ncbi:MAG: hypothetical protein JWL83_65 [Actinomycetia bacterium]|nr:hypothetical protein [Actinomycetes bacterium]